MTTSIGASGAGFGGPAGAVAASIVSGIVAEAVAPATKRRGSAANPVQGAHYGAAVPRVYGRMRLPGQVIWASVPVERTETSSGKGAPSSARNLIVSIALALSSRPILRVERVWADGRLVRDTSKDARLWRALRVYQGNEAQLPDPLILATEGASAPAFRGLAYVVVAELSLASFGNRMPEFNLEVVADEGEITGGAVAADLVRTAGFHPFVSIGNGVALTGAAAGYEGSFADDLGAIELASGFEAEPRRGELSARREHLETIISPSLLIPAPGGAAFMQEQAAGVRGSRWTIRYADVDRDFQTASQSSRAPAAGEAAIEETLSLPVALRAAEALRLAEEIRGSAAGERLQIGAALPLPFLLAEAMDRFRFGDGPDCYQLRRATLSEHRIEASFAKASTSASAQHAADPGRQTAVPFVPRGEVTPVLLDLPTLPGESLSLPRMLVGCTASGGWSPVTAWASFDGGASYASLGDVSRPIWSGRASTVLPSAPTNVWDRTSELWLDTDAPAGTFVSVAEPSVLTGANLMLVGEELIHFAEAEAVAEGRVRLQTLLRGVFGTEGTTGGHGLGESAYLLDRAALLSIPVGQHLLGASVRLKAVRAGEEVGDVPYYEYRWSGRQFECLAPTRLRIEPQLGGAYEISWIRRSRAGFAWPDFVDTPLGEATERYSVRVEAGGRARIYSAAAERFSFTLEQQIADFGAAVSGLQISVSEAGDWRGEGRAVSTTFSG